MEVTEADVKSIVVIVSPLETLMLDVAETFTAMDTSHANFVSQHHSSGLPFYSLFKLSAKSSSGTPRHYQTVTLLLISSLAVTVYSS